MKHRIVSFKCSGRIKFTKITTDSKFCIMVDFDQKSSIILILDLFDADKKKSIRKSNIIENDLVSICVSNDQELIACVTKDWNLIILSFEKLRILDQLKVVSAQMSESTVENVSFFPNENKRLLILGNKLIKIFLYTKKGLKIIFSLDCDFFLLNTCWLSKTEVVSYDKFANLFLIEPKQNLIRTIILKNLAPSDESQLNLVRKKSELSMAYSLANTSMDSKKLDKTSIDTHGSKTTILKFSRLDSIFRPKTHSIYQINSSTIKCLICARKGFFMCFQNDDRIFYYENSKNIYTFHQQSVMRLKKFEKYKLVDKNFKEIILNVQINQAQSYLVVLTSRKMVYQCDLSDFFANNYKEIELEPAMDSYFSDSVVGIDYCVRKSLIAICTSDRWLILWNYDTNSVELKQNFDEELLTVAFHPSGLYLILSGTNSLKYMSIYLEWCKVVHVLNVHSCKNCIFSHGGHLFALIHGTIIQVFSSVKFNEIGSIKSQDMGKIKQLRFSNDDHYLLCCSMAGIIRIWNSQSLNLITEITTKGLSYIGLDLHPNQEWLFLISTEKNIRQFQIIVSEEHRKLIKPNAEPRLVQKFSTKPDENVTCIEISKSGKILCIGTNKGCLRVYSLSNPEHYHDYRAHYGSVNK
ncbi:Cilia- and flagella-associated 57, partial [Brachionus plicatilis]